MAHVRNARTPMIIGQGMADERVPPEQMIQLHHALRLNGVDKRSAWRLSLGNDVVNLDKRKHRALRADVECVLAAHPRLDGS